MRSLIAGAAVLLCVAAAHAQTPPAAAAALNPERVITQYLRTVWQRAEGLPQNTIMDVVQTRAGYLWAATEDGLVRFDGVRFTLFNTTTDPVLRSDNFTTLLEDRQQTLWAGTNGGLYFLRNGRFEAFSAAPLPSDIVTDLYEEPDGTLWIATNAGLARVARGTATIFTTAHGLPSGSVRAVTRDRQGGIWAATEGGVARLRGDRFVPAAPETQLPSIDTRVLYTARDGTIWIGTIHGLFGIRDGTFRTIQPGDGLSGEFVRAIHEDAAGTLWVGTQDGGVNRIRPDGRIDKLGTAEGLSSDDVRAFVTDTEGDLWIGTNVGGLVRLKDPKVLTYGQPEGLPSDIVLPVAADTAGSLWVGTYGGGLARLSNPQWTRYGVSAGLGSDVVLSLAPSSNGSMWVGTRAGVNRVSSGRIEKFGRREGMPQGAIVSLLEDRTGALWVGTRSGLFRFDGRLATPIGGAGSDSVFIAIFEARDGTMWFGTEGRGAATLVKGALTRFSPKSALADAIVLNIAQDDSGALWFATNGRGLARYRDGRLQMYYARDGLIDDVIYRVIDDSAGNLWFSSNIGIQRMGRQQFADFDAHRIPRMLGESFTEADGMRSSECNGAIQPAGWRTPDGILWFPTIKGLVRIDPTALALNHRPPPVVIERVVVDGRELSPEAARSVAPGARSLEFRYTALSFRSPGKVRFRYRLEGFDRDWIDGGDRRTAYYTSLPPDTYTFRVIAANDDGIWNEEGAVTAVALQPYFSQTKTFYLLVAATLGLVLFGLHRARVSGLRAREQELARVAEERRWALVALQDSEAQFRTLFENVNEGVYRATPDGRIVLANHSMARLLGYDSVEELLLVRLQDLYVDLEDYEKLVALVTESGEARAVEMRLRRRDGREVVVLQSVRRVRGSSDSLVYFEGALVDITDRKQLEEQLMQLQKIESIGRLAGGVAHDVNNLLTPILGQADLLAEELHGDDRRRARVDQIRKAALSARSFTRQLLAFSRRQVLKRRIVNLNDALGEVEEILRRLVGEHIDLRIVRDPHLERVRVDAGQLEQVIINLVVNAREAMPLGGAVTVETANVAIDDQEAAQHPGLAPGRYVRLTVTDTGEGISPEVRTRLFEPFVTTKPQGNGLGLALVHGIITQSGGHVTVDSEPGHGASFKVSLPALDDAVVERTVAARPAQHATGQTILLVEDDDDVRAIAAEMLERVGYRVLAANDAGHAQRIEADVRGPIDLLLTDVIMPGLGGPALAEILRPRRPGLRVLYTTGYIDDDVAHHGVLRPDVMVLEKPFTFEALVQAVQECLAAPVP